MSYRAFSPKADHLHDAFGPLLSVFIRSPYGSGVGDPAMIFMQDAYDLACIHLLNPLGERADDLDLR